MWYCNYQVFSIKFGHLWLRCHITGRTEQTEWLLSALSYIAIAIDDHIYYVLVDVTLFPECHFCPMISWIMQHSKWLNNQCMPYCTCIKFSCSTPCGIAWYINFNNTLLYSEWPDLFLENSKFYCKKVTLHNWGSYKDLY